MKKLKMLIGILVILFPVSIKCQNWQQFGNGFDCLSLSTFYVDSSDNSLYAGGDFISSNNDTIIGIAHWNGLTWDSLGSGIYDGVTSIIKYNEQLYAAGGFNILQGGPADRIAQWNGTDWLQVGGGIDNVVFDLTEYNNELYAVGFFATAGGVATNKVAKWNGSNWSDVGSPPFALCTIRSSIVYKGELYVAGVWESDSGRTGIARWDGMKWKALGNGIRGFGMDGGVWALAVYNNELYVGGEFNQGSDDPGNFIAKWDGTEWSEVGGGMNGIVKAFIVYNNELYACGDFTIAGGILARVIAKWNGTDWCGLGTNFNSAPYKMSVYNNELIIGGDFSSIDGFQIRKIAKWIGGSYVDTCGNTSGIEELLVTQNELQLYPNPFTNSTTLQTTKPLQNASLFVYDMIGKKVKNIDNLNGTEIKISGDGMKSGMYFFTVNDAKGFVGNGKMIVE